MKDESLFYHDQVKTRETKYAWPERKKGTGTVMARCEEKMKRYF